MNWDRQITGIEYGMTVIVCLAIVEIIMTVIRSGI